jgi:hypothetical protein
VVNGCTDVRCETKGETLPPHTPKVVAGPLSDDVMQRVRASLDPVVRWAQESQQPPAPVKAAITDLQAIMAEPRQTPASRALDKKIADGNAAWIGGSASPFLAPGWERHEPEHDRMGCNVRPHQGWQPAQYRSQHPLRFACADCAEEAGAFAMPTPPGPSDLDTVRAMLERAGVDYNMEAWGPASAPNSWRVIIRRGGRFFVSFNTNGSLEGKHTIGVIE